MKPIFIRPLTDEERQTVLAGLRSADAFMLRRCQILLASERKERAPHIAGILGCNDQTVRNVIADFNDKGLEVLKAGSSRPHTIHAAFAGYQAEKLRGMLHQSPRQYGKATSVWTLDLAAEVSLEQGLTPERVSGETIRATLVRLGVPRPAGSQAMDYQPGPGVRPKKGAATG